MEFKISKAILDKTTKCQSNFSCLTGENLCGGKKMCKAKDLIDTIIVVDYTSKEGCPYAVYLDDPSPFCTCPTRNEIYRLYKV